VEPGIRPLDVLVVRVDAASEVATSERGHGLDGRGAHLVYGFAEGGAEGEEPPREE